MNSDEPPSTVNQPAPRVVHLDDGRLWRGGQHQVWLLLGELARRGIAQMLVAHDGCPLTLRAREAGIEVETVHFRGEWDWRTPRRIAALADAFGANLLHAHTSHAHTLGLRALRQMRQRGMLVTTRRVDFAIRRNILSRRKYKLPGQHFIAISRAVRDVLVAGGVAPERIDVVHSGVPPIAAEKLEPRAAVRAELGLASDEIAIVNIGALTDHKGQRWLIEAGPEVFRAFPRARIHILGEGELRPALEQRIRELNLRGRVILHGHVENARLKLAAFDLFVSSSHLEGLGTVNLDAMLAGVPVVAAAAGGVPEIVEDGRTGRLVPARDAVALARAIVEALSNPAETAAMIERGRRHVEEHFSAASMAAGTLAVYRKLLAAHAAAGFVALGR